MIKKIDIAGLQLDNYTVREMLMRVDRRISEKILTTIEEVNMDTLALAESDEEVKQSLEACDYTEIVPMPGLTDLLQRLRDAGIRCAVGSSGYKPNVDFVLEKCRIEPYFDARISGDMVSRCKPDPEIYLTAAAALGLTAAECVVFEDAPAGIEAARRAGAGHIVALATTLDRAALAQTDADRVIDDFRDITDLAALLK